MTVPTTERPIGLWSATALVAASMIGAGIFATSGYALEQLGSPERVLAAWVIGGVVAIAGAVSYGALARRLTESGGEYVFLARNIHPLAGFLAGWVSLIAGFAGATAIAATALGTYAIPHSIAGGRIVAIALIAFCALQHALRVESGAWLQNAIVLLKFLGLAALAIVGGWWLAARLESPPSPTPPAFEWFAMGHQLTWVALSYSGFNAAVYLSEEIRDPARNVPRAMLIATVAVFVLYMALNVVFVYAGPVEELKGQGDIAAVAVGMLGGATAAGLCRVLICIALFSSISALTMAGPRVYAKMAVDGLFPLPVAPSGCPPRAAIALQAGLAMLVVSWITPEDQFTYLGFMLSVSAAATVASLLIATRHEAKRPTPLQLAAAALFVVASLTFATLSAIREYEACAIAGGLTLASGVAAYFAMRWWSRTRA
ncbi:MAG: APC family permease [Aeoliella sp.]